MPRCFSLLFCFTITLGGLAASACAGASQSGTVAALFPPWWAPSRSFAAAASAGAIVAAGGTSFVLIVHSARPGLAERLRAAGALLLFNPLGAHGCGQPLTQVQNV